jgi:hypothetical protein
MIGSVEAETPLAWEKQKVANKIKKILLVVLINLNTTLFEKQILKLP